MRTHPQKFSGVVKQTRTHITSFFINARFYKHAASHAHADKTYGIKRFSTFVCWLLPRKTALAHDGCSCFLLHKALAIISRSLSLSRECRLPEQSRELRVCSLCVAVIMMLTNCSSCGALCTMKCEMRARALSEF
jgi:hypothetical protein